MQATIKTMSGKHLPEGLRELTDPPERLYVRGSIPEERPVAMVGTRRPTVYGRRVAGMLAARLAAAGVPVISGLAFGIDTCAHRAALDAGGRTIAVLPGGVDPESVSPRSNLRVADQIIAQKGAVVSEQPPGTESQKHLYLSRNRLISGWSRAVVVVEAMLPSGSLVTAQHATDQHRELWAVPGPIDSPTSAGTNKLIADGANPLVSIDEFLAAIGVRTADNPVSTWLDEFLSQPIHLDDLAERSDRPLPELETELTRLELRGLVKRLDGRTYVRT